MSANIARGIVKDMPSVATNGVVQTTERALDSFNTFRKNSLIVFMSSNTIQTNYTNLFIQSYVVAFNWIILK